MEALLGDLRYSLRTLAKSPGFSVVAVLTLALGIGAATTGFTLLNWVLLRPLPGIRDGGRLGLVWFAAHSSRGYQPWSITTQDRDDILKRSAVVSALVGRQRLLVNLAVTDQAPRQVGSELVMPGYLEVLGVTVQRGRGLIPADDPRPAGREVAVISDHLWRDAFGSRPDIVGALVRLNGVPFTVVGVMALGFRGTDLMGPVDMWIPANTYWTLQHFSDKHRPSESTSYEFVARIRPDASFTLAERQLKAATRMLVRADTARFDSTVTANVFPGLGLPVLGRDLIDQRLALVMGIAGLVLLVACANVANLLLVRRTQRRSDAVVRLVLGASRGRLARHFLAESIVLGLLGSVGGLLVAFWTQGVFKGFQLYRIPLDNMREDWRVLAFAAVVGLVAPVVAGVVPALLGSRADLGAELNAVGPRLSGGAPRLRAGLAILQVTVSLTLVAGAYLFARTLQNYARVPLGFDPARVAVFDVSPKSLGYSEAQSRAYFRTLMARIAELPGVESVALAQLLPFVGASYNANIRRADSSGDQQPLQVTTNTVTADYFRVLRIPLVRGTGFQSGDILRDSVGAVAKAILSQSGARRLFGGTDPLGRLIEFKSFEESARQWTVVGIVGDVRWSGFGGDVTPMLYTPFNHGDPFGSAMIVVSAGPPLSALTRGVTEAGRALDPGLPVRVRGRLSDVVADSISDRTFLFRLVGLLAALTLLLTGVGVYALVAYGVTTRTREFGVRMALGAETPDIVRAAVRPALGIVVGGVVGGVAGALYLTRFIAASLYGVSRFDPAAFVTAAAVLAAAVFLASYLPARRAAKVDPMVALRYE